MFLQEYFCHNINKYTFMLLYQFLKEVVKKFKTLKSSQMSSLQTITLVETLAS